MLKTTWLLDLGLRDNDNEIIKNGDDDRNLSKFKKLKNAKSGILTYIGAIRESKFQTISARETFKQLR